MQLQILKVSTQSQNGHLDCVKLLLKHRADIEGRGGFTADAPGYPSVSLKICTCIHLYWLLLLMAMLRF